MIAMRRAKEPVEKTAKRVMLIKGASSSQTMNDVMQDIALISKPNHKQLTRKNDILPFEDVNSLEFLGQKNECNLFAFVSHTKKRPHNLVLVSAHPLSAAQCTVYRTDGTRLSVLSFLYA
jgi:ribosome production factor 2